MGEMICMFSAISGIVVIEKNTACMRPIYLWKTSPAEKGFLITQSQGEIMQEYDLIIRNGTIYDGSGNAPYKGDVAIQGDVIAAVGDLGDARGKRELDVNGLAV